MVDESPRVGCRVVLNCKNGLAYAGVVTGYAPTPRGQPAVIVELDADSGFSVLCPLQFVAGLREVPIGRR